MNKEAMRKLLEEIILDFLDIWDNGFNKEDAAAIVNQWTKTPCGSRLIDSLCEGEEDCYIPIAVTKFGDLPPVMTEVVVFFKNRKEPFIGYREVDNVWYDETGQGTKTPTHWLKKIKK